MIGEKIDFKTIGQMTKTQLKKHIKEKVKSVTLDELKDIQKEHSKVLDIHYSKLDIQDYLKKISVLQCWKWTSLCPQISHKKGVKGIFSSLYKNNISCPLNCHETKPEDSQIHILNCERIKAHLNETETESIQYSDIYGSLAKQKDAVKIFQRAFEIREKLLKKDSDLQQPTSGTSLDTATRACQGSSGDY